MAGSYLKLTGLEAVKPIQRDSFLKSYEEFSANILKEGILTTKEKMLILIGIYSSKG
jgi:hypothetical protein